MSGAPTAGRGRTTWLTVFAVSMGILEAAVVVYLRELYYPDGFRFPIVLAPGRIAVTELAREATTLVMLLSVAALAGRDRLDRFFVFAYLFGVWDLVYYAGLLGVLGWPSSLFTWDVLFLIPVPWSSPVLCPVLVSLALVTGYAAHRTLFRKGRALRPTRGECLAAVAGGVLVVVSFCWNFRVVLEERVPRSFPWWLFAVGFLLGFVPFARAIRRAALSLPAEPVKSE